MDKNRSFYQLGSVAGPVIQATGRLELRRLEAYWFANTKWTYLVYVRYMVSNCPKWRLWTKYRIGTPYTMKERLACQVRAPTKFFFSFSFFLQFWRFFFSFWNLEFLLSLLFRHFKPKKIKLLIWHVFGQNCPSVENKLSRCLKLGWNWKGWHTFLKLRKNMYEKWEWGTFFPDKLLPK